jgi:hypothetical protein
MQSAFFPSGCAFLHSSTISDFGFLPFPSLQFSLFISLIALDLISDDEHNRFTKRDVLDAMNMYQESYVTYSRAEVERVSGISVPPNKRNGRKQEQHIKIMNAIRDIEHPDGEWRNKDGRPEKSKIVEEWRKAHPDGRKADCIRETGLSKPTVYKWWK